MICWLGNRTVRTPVLWRQQEILNTPICQVSCNITLPTRSDKTCGGADGNSMSKALYSFHFTHNFSANSIIANNYRNRTSTFMFGWTREPEYGMLFCRCSLLVCPTSLLGWEQKCRRGWRAFTGHTWYWSASASSTAAMLATLIDKSNFNIFLVFRPVLGICRICTRRVLFRLVGIAGLPCTNQQCSVRTFCDGGGRGGYHVYVSVQKS